MTESWFIHWHNHHAFPHRLSWASASHTSGCPAFLRRCCARSTGHAGRGWLLTSPLPSCWPCVARSLSDFRSVTSLGCYPAHTPFAQKLERLAWHHFWVLVAWAGALSCCKTTCYMPGRSLITVGDPFFRLLIADAAVPFSTSST